MHTTPSKVMYTLPQVLLNTVNVEPDQRAHLVEAILREVNNLLPAGYEFTMFEVPTALPMYQGMLSLDVRLVGPGTITLGYQQAVRIQHSFSEGYRWSLKPDWMAPGNWEGYPDDEDDQEQYSQDKEGAAIALTAALGNIDLNAPWALYGDVEDLASVGVYCAQESPVYKVLRSHLDPLNGDQTPLQAAENLTELLGYTGFDVW